MISLTYVVLAMIYCGMVCDGLDAAASPCGMRLCTDLCDSLSTCSSPDYRVETLTCVLRNGSLGVGQGGVRECRTLTSRRGDIVTVCSEAGGLKDGNRVDVSGLKPGTIVLLVNNLYGVYADVVYARESPTFLYGVYAGNQSVILIHHQTSTQKRLDDSLAIKSVITYTAGKTQLLNSSEVLECAKLSLIFEHTGVLGDRDFVIFCLTGMTYEQAQLLGFKIIP